MSENSFYSEDAMIYSLTDEDGKQWEFELLDEMDYADAHYYALTPAMQSEEDSLTQARSLVVMRAVENEETGEEEMETIGEDEFERIGAIFLERLGVMEDALYDDEEDYGDYGM